MTSKYLFFFFFNFGRGYLASEKFSSFHKSRSWLTSNNIRVFHRPDSSGFNIHVCHATPWIESLALHPAIHTSIGIVYGQWMGAYGLVNRNFSLVFKTRLFHQKTLHCTAENVQLWWQTPLGWKRPLRSLGPSAVVHSIGLGGLQVLSEICRAFVCWTTSASDLQTIILFSVLWHSSGSGTARAQASQSSDLVLSEKRSVHLCHQSLDMNWGLIKGLSEWSFNTTLIHGSPTNTH